MAHSHHSHSGQFCEHAIDALEAVVQTAIDRKLKVLCLTEHMPRGRDQDIYAGEVSITPVIQQTPNGLAMLTTQVR